MVTQPVAEQVEREHGEHDGKPRENADPRCLLHISAAIGKHAAPAWNLRVYAQTEKGKAAFEENVVGNIQGGKDHQRTNGIGQDMAEKNMAVRQAITSGRLHVFHLPQ